MDKQDNLFFIHFRLRRLGKSPIILKSVQCKVIKVILFIKKLLIFIIYINNCPVYFDYFLPILNSHPLFQLPSPIHQMLHTFFPGYPWQANLQPPLSTTSPASPLISPLILTPMVTLSPFSNARFTVPLYSPSLELTSYAPYHHILSWYPLSETYPQTKSPHPLV